MKVADGVRLRGDLKCSPPAKSETHQKKTGRRGLKKNEGREAGEESNGGREQNIIGRERGGGGGRGG